MDRKYERKKAKRERTEKRGGGKKGTRREKGEKSYHYP